MRSAPVSPTYRAMLITASVVVVLDQITKQLALDALADGPIDVIEGVLRLNLHFNPGGAFGLLQGIPGFFLISTIVIAGVLIVWARHVDDPSWGIPLGLVLGGGLGNLYDRLFRDTGGRVVDFIDLHVWPVFNLADSAIVCGVGLLLLLTFLADRKERARERS